MLWLFTAPVISRISACLGSPVLTTPNLSASYRGVRQASTSMSHPLQLEPS